MTITDRACDCLEHADGSWCCADMTGAVPDEYRGWMLLTLMGLFCVGTIWIVLTKRAGEK